MKCVKIQKSLNCGNDIHKFLCLSENRDNKLWKVACIWSLQIWKTYLELVRISPYSVWMWENTGQNNSKYEHFLRSECVLKSVLIYDLFLKNQRDWVFHIHVWKKIERETQRMKVFSGFHFKKGVLIN